MLEKIIDFVNNFVSNLIGRSIWGKIIAGILVLAAIIAGWKFLKTSVKIFLYVFVAIIAIGIALLVLKKFSGNL